MNNLGYIQGENRLQMLLIPECIDDYIDENNPVRIIDAFVASLDLKELGFQRVIPAETGRPSYHPSDLLKLYIYGYMNRIRSSRRLEKESGRNLEMLWLMGKLQPDFKTIADYRKGNKAAIKAVFRQFTLLCKKWDLYGGELIAVDGSKFKAMNSKKNNFNQAKLDKRIKDIDQKIDQYMKDIDQGDQQEETDRTIGSEEIYKRIHELLERKTTYEQYKATLEKNGETQISTTDQDARSMPTRQSVEVCYNIQSTVDDKHKLIVDFETTNQVKDHGQLSIMSKRAKEILDVDSIEVLADKGYYKAVDLKECVDHGITPYVPKPENANAGEDKEFHTENFRYDSEKDIHTCPAGQELTCRNTYHKDNKVFKRYTNYDACRICPLRERCTKAKVHGRNIDRWEHQDILEKIQLQTKDNVQKYRKRQWLVEHPFGTVKRGFDMSYVLTKGKASVNAEIALSFLSYNLKRVIQIVGVKEMIRRLEIVE